MSDLSAVKTTGIYCLPECSARPHPRNVQSFGTAAAAEAAGFRACLRCRPYRAAPAMSWSGPELVCRAVQMILDGALDGQDEDRLGAHLGISARHLRRLFEEQMGVTPDRLARSRRAHFARRLLDDTDLTVTQVAFAAGFGSVRQFNRSCLETFRAPPRELRARRRKSDRLAADGGLILRLAHQPPLAWEAMLDYFRGRAIAGVEHVSQESYRRTVRIDGDPGVIEISPGAHDHLLLRIHLPHWQGLIHHVQRARRIFNLDFDLDAARRDLRPDSVIGPLLEDRPGLRPPGTWDPFETGVRAIVGQQVSVAGANTIIARLVKRHGDPVANLHQLGLTHLFPTATALAGANLEDLGLTKARARAINAFARAVTDGAIALDRSMSLDRLLASITATAGLGPWTAHYIALRLGEPDAFPGSDLGLLRSLAVATGRNVTANEAEGLAEHWRPHRALGAIHLWLASASISSPDARATRTPRAARAPRAALGRHPRETAQTALGAARSGAAAA